MSSPKNKAKVKSKNIIFQSHLISRQIKRPEILKEKKRSFCFLLILKSGKVSVLRIKNRKVTWECTKVSIKYLSQIKISKKLISKISKKLLLLEVSATQISLNQTKNWTQIKYNSLKREKKSSNLRKNIISQSHS